MGDLGHGCDETAIVQFGSTCLWYVEGRADDGRWWGDAHTSHHTIPTGMIIAIVASHKATVKTSECAWYFVAFTFDTTLGVAITVALHRVCLHAARVANARRATPSHVLDALIECGHYGRVIIVKEGWCMCSVVSGWRVPLVCMYTPPTMHPHYACTGNPPSTWRWALQLTEWTLCVILARAAVGTLV